MTPIQSRRRMIVLILLSLAVVGAVVRQLTDRSSLTHDLGTLLMVMWVPAVGNIIGYFLQKWGPKSRRPPAFAAGSAFVAHRRATLQLDGVPPCGGAELPCTLLLGSEGYTARIRSAFDADATGVRKVFELEFLAPALALPLFPPGTAFRLLLGGTVAGEGRVLDVAEVAAEA